MLKRLIGCAAAWLLCLTLNAGFAKAHDLPVDHIMNGFVKIGPTHADLVVRVPLDLLLGVPFPLRGDHYDIAASGPPIQTALQALASTLQLSEGNVRLAASSAAGRLSPLSDRSFESYDEAAAAISRPLPPDTVLGFQMGYLDVHFVYPISSPNSVFWIESSLAAELGDYIKLAIRVIPLDEPSRAMMVTGASGRVALDPAWYQASAGFIKLGIGHILGGVDHLLFLLCLIIPFRRVRSLVPVITAFTVGHSVTLIGTAYGLAPAGRWFPPFVETAIALSIVYMALENIIGASLRRRWVIAGLFGLVHGFGFADVLGTQLQFAGSNLLVSLLSFNIGIEIGQLAVLCAFVPALALLFRGALSGRMGIIVVSAIVAHTAWHWMLDRADVLWRTPWPQPTPAGLMVMAQWILGFVLAVGVASLLTKWAQQKWPAQVLSARRITLR
ncbi:MAG TPA: HupE/UreJ family protein [Xanthobacteraceae bacterium]|nr:HupE/UreJ family protein [Xanthobacteraceae bacterium]